jgi:hypothetical protein
MTVIYLTGRKPAQALGRNEVLEYSEKEYWEKE